MSTLRRAVIRVAHAQPKLRGYLLPLLDVRVASNPWRIVKVDPMQRDNSDDSHHGILWVILEGMGGEKKYLSGFYDLSAGAISRDFDDINAKTTVHGDKAIIEMYGSASSGPASRAPIWYDWETTVTIDLTSGEFVGGYERGGLTYLPIKTNRVWR